MFINKIKNQTKESNKFLWEKGCNFCRERFGDEEKFTEVKIQDGSFRGDDEIYVFHRNCYGRGLEKLEAIIPGLHDQREIDNKSRREQRARRRKRQRERERWNDGESVAEQMTCR